MRLAPNSYTPVIDHQLIGDPRDVATLVRACRLIQKLFSAKSWNGAIVRDRTPDRGLRDGSRMDRLCSGESAHLLPPRWDMPHGL